MTGVQTCALPISQTIVDKANEERPPGINTDVIERVGGERAAYVQAGVAQESEESRAQRERAQRDAMVEEIKRGRMDIQLAAEGLWPSGVATNEGVRGEFKLPPNRPFVV